MGLFKRKPRRFTVQVDFDDRSYEEFVVEDGSIVVPIVPPRHRIILLRIDSHDTRKGR